ncbi:MAG: SGNH/GDSL hydrolase family protein [Cyanobacteria bacterium P01_F01_bin.150]
MNHLILLGDSIFDNRAYVEPGPDVVTQLRAILPSDWDATLLAIDGSVTRDVIDQLGQLPTTATHLIISAGGNNALREAALLMQDPPGDAIASLQRFVEMKALFHHQYRQMLDAVLAKDLAITLCTIYDQCPTQDPYMKQLIYSALPMYNDCIFREAIQAGLPLLDLRVVCNQPEDYAANAPIEPSVQGGEKIATQIAYLLNHHNFSNKQSSIYGIST